MQKWHSRGLIVLALLLVGVAGTWVAMDPLSWAGGDRVQVAQAEESAPAARDRVGGAQLAQAEDDSDLNTDEKPNLDVPYVPTDQKVVDEMLRLVNVKKGDVLYDLGCGDGRIVVTAAKRYGATGFGVDIDPQRIRESRANAREAGVTDKVKFEVRDLFTMDVRPATVLTMYLLPSVNLKLRPKLFKELRPGARLVSHDFTMGNWQPDKTVLVEGPYRQHTLYHWVMPANAAGEWSLSLPKNLGGGKGTLSLQQTFQEVSGTLRAGNRSIPVTMGKMNGTQIAFNAARTVNGKSVPVRFVGQVNGNTLKGNVTSGNNKQAVTGKRTQQGQIRQPTSGE